MSAIIIEPAKPNDRTTSGPSSAAKPAANRDSDGTIIIEPATVTGTIGADSGDSEPKRRGRPRGSTNARTSGTAKKATPLDINGVERLIYGIHAGIATMAKAPEFALDHQESKLLAESIANVSQHYDVAIASPKTMAWMDLCATVGMVYGPRLAIMRMRNAQNKPAPKPAPQPQPSNGAAPPRHQPPKPAPQPLDVAALHAGAAPFEVMQ